MDNQKLTQLILEQWRPSPIIKDMREADKYYRCENTAISQKKRGYTNPKTKEFEQINTVSNEKLFSGFIRQSVNQKVAYGFGKPFVLSVNGEDDELKDRYTTEWNNFITPYFRKQLKSIAREAINNGIGWGFVYIDPNDELLKVDNYKSETLYPKWIDDSHKNFDALVRDYIEQEYTDNGIQNVNKVELWTENEVEKYIANGLELEPDGDENISTHLNNQQGWGRIPFIFLKSSDDEMPLLKLIKSYIDGYDELNSKSVDSLIDDIEPVVLFKGISAEIHDLTEAKELFYTLKSASVEEQGDVNFLQAKIDIDNVQKKLENIKKDIKEFSCTVNTQDIQFGSNPSGIALKAAYQDLDIYMNDIETEFELFMQQLKYFFDKYQVFKGNFTEAELKQLDITVTLDRDMMLNETELIENTAKLSGLVSQETLDGYNPAVESHEIEQERRDNEEDERLEKSNPYNFGNEPDTEPEPDEENTETQGE